MESLDKLERRFEAERKLIYQNQFHRERPVTFALGVVSKSLILTANIVVRPFKYVFYYYGTYVYSKLNREFFLNNMLDHERTFAEVDPDELDGEPPEAERL